ncbi:MAG: hypothetical protein IT454_16690 [Planctomycetes bacterium]|nr:hypothetical protein [Planctomycetota bacterium]
MYALLVWFTLTQSVAAKPPTTKALEQRIERFLALDARVSTEYQERCSIARELAEIEVPDEKAEKTWRERLAKLLPKSAARLERESGRHFLWPEDKKGSSGKGLYLVGGATKKPKGLLIGLHGGGVGSGDAESARAELESVAQAFDLVGIFPEVLEKTERGWTDSGTEEFVVDLIEAAIRTWGLDRDRVYLSGHSMGGYGSWMLGAHHADLVAAIAPSAGAPTPVMNSAGSVIDVSWGVIPNLRNVRVRIYQSDNDLNVPPAANRIAAQKLGEARERWGGFDFEYWEVPGRAHELPPGGMRALFEKVADARREPRPTKLVWQPALEWKRQFYWLAWDVPRKHALVEAELDVRANAVHVRCDQDPKGLAVLVDDELLDLDRELLVTLEGREVFRGKPRRSLATLLESGARNDARSTYSARIELAP